MSPLRPLRVSPRAAVTVFFALDGFAVAGFFARLPAIQDRLELSNGRIGLALLALTITLLVSQPLAAALASRRGSAPLVVAGALLAAAGMVVAATAPAVPVAVAGFALGGLGLSALFPLMVRAASDRAGDVPGPAIAAVSTAGYGGLVTGPPLVGFLAEATSLRFALAAVLGVLCVTAAALAAAAR